MAEIYKFFNSAPGDPRTYQAADFASYFGNVLSTGLLHTDEVPGMEVSVETGTLKTVVSAGKAIMRGYAYENTDELTLTHAIPEVTLDRIDRIILRLNLTNSERNIKIAIKQGVSAAIPQAPTLQRDDVIYEISLAQVTIRKNTAQILAVDLKDERLDEEVCGIVHSLISIPTSQFQKQWDDFIRGVQDEGFATTELVESKVAEGLINANEYTDSRVSVGNYGNATLMEANSYRLDTSSGKPSALVEGATVRFRVSTPNTGIPRIAVNSTAYTEIRRSNGSQITGPLFRAGSIYTITYNGTVFILQGEGGEYGTAGPAQVLTGYTVGTDNGVVAGTLVPGKRFAKGSFTTDASGNRTVSGLSFTPRVIIVAADESNDGSFLVVGIYSDEIKNRGNTINTAFNQSSGAVLMSSFTVGSGNFRFELGFAGSRLYNYIAYE